MSVNGRLVLFALVLAGPVGMTLASFGDDISQDNEDNRFAVMGQVTKDEFNVDNGQVTLQLNVQDTAGIMEIWILDFQEYRFNLDAMPVDEFTGDLMMGRTSACSSVYEDSSWNTFFNDSYFQNKEDAALSTKSLFTTFARGPDDDGIMRNNKVVFSGTMATFFACKDSSDEGYVWELTGITADEIEYRTKLYATNVRPKDPVDPSGGVSFVQSHIELIWRISRTALTKFLISSTALIQPILKFARVSAVYDEQNRPVATQTALHIKFKTIVDSTDQMISYQTASIAYIPENINHGLNQVVYQPMGTVDTAPLCTLEMDEGTNTQIQCHQTWEFKVVLDVDTSAQVDNRVPIDASGTFEFLYNVYQCDDISDVTTCQLVSIDPSKISALITIQTTVFVQDEEEDQVTILLHSLTGASNEDLSYSNASRGVAHMEFIDFRVKFSPSMLRKDYDLDLLLFMVCQGEEYAGNQYLQGCLQAPLEDRYVAHKDPGFSYTPRIRTADGTVLLSPYNTTHVADDILQPLEERQYLREEAGQTLSIPVHRSTFYNKALSAEAAVYTITAVYRLIEKPLVRRRRSILPLHQDVLLTRGVVMGRPGKTTGTIVTRHARDVQESALDAHVNTVPYLAMGCPDKARHVREDERLDCVCPSGMEYSLNSFDCEEAQSVQVEDEVLEDDDSGDVNQTASARQNVCSIWLTVVAISMIFGALNE